MIDQVLNFFSFLSNRQASRENVRLDLRKERLEVYNHIIKMCSILCSFGPFPQIPDATNDLDSALKAITGLGYHKICSLFEDDIRGLAKELHHKYLKLSALQHVIDIKKESGQYVGDKEVKKLELMQYFLDKEQELKTLFKPYIYFGDYKC